MTFRARPCLLLAVLLVAAAPAAAHQFAPAALALEEISEDRIDVSWKQPVVRVMGSRLRPTLPPECEGIADPVVRTEGTGMRATWQIRCPGGLAGKTVGVEGIAASRAGVLLRITLADGRKLQTILEADAPSYEIRLGAGRLGVFHDYAVLGLEHILTGWDHLLFVLALVLLVGWGARLLWTITAFTLGHSVTLALTALGLVHVPRAPIEAAIALSIYFLAVVPVIVAGGKMPKGVDETKDSLELAYDSIQTGARGIDFGRRVWRHKQPVAMIRALRAVIHDGMQPKEAYKLFQELKGSKKGSKG